MCQQKGLTGILQKGLALMLCAALALAGFPMSARAEEPATSGDWGECSWSFEGTTLHVWPKNGTSGRLANFGGDLPNPNVPWLDVASKIEYLDVQRGVMLPEDCGYMLYGCSFLRDFNASQWDTSNVVSMRGMFAKCNRLNQIDVRNWNTSNVTDMQDMFKDCWAIGAIIDPTKEVTFIPSKWDTSQVTNMSGMFSGCNALLPLDLSKWNTSNVTDMSEMFEDCFSLTDSEAFKISSWDTSKVTDMHGMFRGCSGLPSVNIPQWNTSSVTDMSEMFSSCKSINELNLSNWNTSSVTDMSGMFSSCESLTTLNLSDWNTSAVENMAQMFNDCTSLFTLHAENWNTTSVTDMNGMFANCGELNPLNLSGWDTTSVTDMNGMFSSCESLYSLSVANWNTSSVEDMANMFYGCSSLEIIDVSKWDTRSVIYMDNMFNYCKSLHSLDLSGWDTSQVESMSSMFQSCGMLEDLDVSTWDTSAVESMWNMFYECDFLKSLDLSSWDTSSVEDMEGMFAGCTQLKTIMVSGLWSTESVYYSDDMFYDCSSIEGGNGTTYDEDCIDAEYARIDSPYSEGYLTLNPELATEPSFKFVNLTIGKQIGMTYWLDLPQLSWLDYEDSYVEFTIDDKAERLETVELTADTPRDSKGLYGFTFDETSIEMAEPVTATFHYRVDDEEMTIEKTFSAEDYFACFDTRIDAYPKETVALVHATANLGYYMQPYLSRTNGWVLGEDYAQMTTSYDEPNIENAGAALSSYAISAQFKDSGIKKASASLSFDSLTALNVFLTPENADAEVQAQATYADKTFQAEKQQDGRWLLRIEGIRPQDLDVAITVEGNGGSGDFSLTTSSFGLLNLSFASGDNVAKNAFASAYEIWDAAQNYQA